MFPLSEYGGNVGGNCLVWGAHRLKESGKDDIRRYNDLWATYIVC